MFSGSPNALLYVQAANTSHTCPYEWTDKYLGECAHNPRQLAGVILGLSSILCWLVAQSPQLYMNFKSKSAQSLSIAFLADWLSGDAFNLIGCVLSQQVATQLYTAIYFVIIDSMMVLQWLLYNKWKKPKTEDKNGTTTLACVLALVVMASVAAPSLLAPTASSEFAVPHRGGGRTLLTIQNFHGSKNIAGYSIGWVSGIMYFTSRLPQIIKNFRRKTCHGLSLAMFVMAVLGNLTYALGILLEDASADSIVDHLPWLVGSIGTLLFDFTIFMQFLCYGAAKPRKADEDEDGETAPLLGVTSGPVPVTRERGTDSGEPRSPDSGLCSPVMLPYDAKSPLKKKHTINA